MRHNIQQNCFIIKIFNCATKKKTQLFNILKIIFFQLNYEIREESLPANVWSFWSTGESFQSLTRSTFKIIKLDQIPIKPFNPLNPFKGLNFCHNDYFSVHAISFILCFSEDNSLKGTAVNSRLFLSSTGSGFRVKGVRTTTAVPTHMKKTFVCLQDRLSSSSLLFLPALWATSHCFFYLCFQFEKL